MRFLLKKRKFNFEKKLNIEKPDDLADHAPFVGDCHLTKEGKSATVCHSSGRVRKNFLSAQSDSSQESDPSEEEQSPSDGT